MQRRSLLVAAAGAVALGALPQTPAVAAARRPGRLITRFNVISDIQGDLGDLGVALEDLHQINPGSSGLAVAGDITPRGYDFEYAAVKAECARHTMPGTVAWAIGNHEFYVPKYSSPSQLALDTWPNGTTEDSLFRGFYNFAGRNTVYTEQSFGGIPVLSLGTERYMHYHDLSLWDQVWMSDAQFAWLEDRLRHWTALRKPVMVITHHPLPHTVSGSSSGLYLNDYLQADRLLSILGRYRDVFLFCGHTHWDLALPDWYARRVVPGTANPDGFSVINTSAVSTGYKDNGAGGDVPVPGTFNQGLQIEVRRNQVLIQARDFARRTWMKQIIVPLHTPI
ncbi:metallophosphoesterase family protein [Streptomyces sp. NPDC085466]|uniref:metallophosphoesterase family protein n=1 Tax=Streptomyces sp. NPDC085466 TaxID=3365725 RepID=UPI0037D41CAE